MKKYVYEITTSLPMQPEMFYKNLSCDNEVRIRSVTKIRALLNKERRKTVARVRAMQQRKQYICPVCSSRAEKSYGHYACTSLTCDWVGKRPAVA